jgi:hypothetical protein
MMKRLLLSALLPIAGIVPALAQTTAWNTADGTGSITYSGSNLIVTSSAAGSKGTRGADPQTSGKYYFECKLTVQASGSTACGVGSDYAWPTTVGSNGNYAAVCYKGGSCWIGGSTPGGVGATLGTSDVIGLAVDLDNKKFWARKNASNWNNNGSADPATNVGGFTLTIPSTATLNVGASNLALPVYPIAVMASSGDQVTANFGATSFAQSVPSGFTSGWPTSTISTTGFYANASITATISGLTASTTAGSTAASGNYNRSTGKYYIEWSVGRQSGSTYGFGLINNTAVAYNAGSDNNGIVYIGSSGIVKRNNATQATYSTYTTNDIVSMAVDLDNNTFFVRKNGGDWNGSALNNPATNTGGQDISALAKPLRPIWVEPSAPASGTDSVTALFGSLAFHYAVPSGFTAGWPVTGLQIGTGAGQGNVVHSPLTHW